MASTSGTSVVGRQVLIDLPPASIAGLVRLTNPADIKYQYRATITVELVSTPDFYTELVQKLYWQGVLFNELPNDGNARQLVAFWHTAGLDWTAIAG